MPVFLALFIIASACWLMHIPRWQFTVVADTFRKYLSIFCNSFQAFILKYMNYLCITICVQLFLQPEQLSQYSDKAMCWTDQEGCFDSQQGHDIISSPKQPEVLRPTQPLVQWAETVLSVKVKWLGYEIDHSPSPRAEVKKICEAVTLLLPCLHSVHKDTFTLLWWFNKYEPFIITITNHISHNICVF